MFTYTNEMLYSHLLYVVTLYMRALTEKHIYIYKYIYFCKFYISSLHRKLYNALTLRNMHNKIVRIL